MNPRTLYIAFMEDLAKRHVDIAHDPASKSTTRFFLELDYEKLLGWNEPQNKGWNLVLMGFETQSDDNRHGRRVEKVSCIFDILKHSKGDDPVALQLLYDQAREIGEEVLIRAREMQDDPCSAIDAGQVSDGITIPYSFRMGTKRTIEVGPRWNNYFGYRFDIELMLDAGVKAASTGAKWRSLTGDPEPTP
jgi:hypothetical protein